MLRRRQQSLAVVIAAYCYFYYCCCCSAMNIMMTCHPHHYHYGVKAFPIMRPTSRMRRKTRALTRLGSANEPMSSSYSSDYQSYNIPSQLLLDKAGGALYRQSVFTKEEFDIIWNEVSSIISSSNKLNKETSSIAQHRLGASLPFVGSATVDILQSPNHSLLQLIQKVTGNNDNQNQMELSTNLPVEVRVYETLGSGMSWHVDDVLYDPNPQLEVVITLENTSDCVTMWKKQKQDDDNDYDNDNNVFSQETDINSALILKAGGPLHCVTSLKRGRRTILKCAYISKDSTFREGIHIDQFGTIKGKKKGKGKNTNKTNKNKKNKKKGNRR